MAEFDFSSPAGRLGTGCVKWDAPTAAGDGVIPMWVADMDFKAAPCILEAVRKRAEHGIFGYTYVKDSYYDAIINWFSRRYGWIPSREDILYTTGVVPAISASIKAISKPGEKVIILTPVYNCFFSSIRNNGCIISRCPLIYGEDRRFHIDFDSLEALCAEKEATSLLLCNPHNPSGRIWTEEELRHIGKIAGRHGVTVISDEIHGDMPQPGLRYIPFATVCTQEECRQVTLTSCSKSFNIAGLQIANIISSDAELLKSIDKAVNINEICDVNPFGPVALEAAYSEEGEKWLEELGKVLQGNFRYMEDLFAAGLPGFGITPLEISYLVWVDCRSLRLSSDEISERLLKDWKVRVCPSSMYGCEGFIRINIACPRRQLEEGLGRIVNGLRSLLQPE